MSKKPKQPMQPLHKDKHGTVRFHENKIVRVLLDWATSRGMGLNELALMDFSDDDRCQFAQLIGYSLGGYHELSYVSDAHAAAATAEAQKQFPDAGGCRDGGCPIHSDHSNDD